MPNFNTYQPPGVYVEGSAASLVSPAGVPSTTVTIVGLSRGYQLATESLIISTTAQPLGNRGVLPDSNPAPDLTVKKLDGTPLVETTDYVLVRGAGSGDATTIARASGSTVIANGDQVVVTYSYADSTYYAPKSFEDFSSVEAIYGPSLVSVLPTDPNATQVYSPLSLAARLAFENGATTVLLIAVEPTTVDFNLLTRFSEAYSKVATNPEVTLLVPVLSQPDGQDAAAYTLAVPGFLSAVRAHCVGAAADGYGRIAFVGADTAYDDTTTTFDELAAAQGSNREVLAFPNRMSFFNQSLNQSTEIGGCYLAAALAGRLAAQNPNRGLTRLQVFGFTGIPDDVVGDMTTTAKNTLSAAGVCVVEVGRTSTLTVRHGVTTDPTDALSSEVSITRSQDVLYRLIADGVEAAALVGEPIDDEMAIRVKGIVAGVLESAVTGLVIAEYITLQVRQQDSATGNPTVIECQFTYRPFLPLNYITVTFSMDLTTGTTTVVDDTASS